MGSAVVEVAVGKRCFLPRPPPPSLFFELHHVVGRNDLDGCSVGIAWI